MVTADNLNLNVLELIFSFLFGNDLPSVALVSRSFLAAVIPRLYNTISYRLRQAKGYDVVRALYICDFYLPAVESKMLWYRRGKQCRLLLRCWHTLILQFTSKT